MADLLISRVAPGVARVRSTDPFDTLEIHRIERSQWQLTPETPGIYLLHGVNAEEKLIVYIGMSTTDMRSRIRSHHVNPAKNWFGVLFAVSVPSALLCPAIEAELIWDLREAGAVDVIANVADPKRMRGSDDVHVEPAVEKIRDALQLILGTEIFVPVDIAEPGDIDAPLERLTPLARAYKGAASGIRSRDQTADPDRASHRWVGAGVDAWGRFEGEEPEKSFRVLQGSHWRRMKLNPDATTFNAQKRVEALQDKLVAEDVLGDEEMTFTRDYVFENWSTAGRIVGGKHSHSGAYHWQRLD